VAIRELGEISWPPGAARTDAWAPLTLTTTANGYEANIPNVSGYQSLRIVASDATGNTMNYEMNPGVLVTGNTGVDDPQGPAPPAAVLALEGAAPNPSPGGMRVRFSLPDARAARLEVLDVAGRLVLSRDVGALGAGPHALDLGRGQVWKPGIYWLRLTHPQQTLTRRACVIR